MNTANEATMNRQRALLEEDGKIKHFTVEIENELIFSCTSEEEDEMEAYLRNKSESMAADKKDSVNPMVE